MFDASAWDLYQSWYRLRCRCLVPTAMRYSTLAYGPLLEGVNCHWTPWPWNSLVQIVVHVSTHNNQLLRQARKLIAQSYGQSNICQCACCVNTYLPGYLWTCSTTAKSQSQYYSIKKVNLEVGVRRYLNRKICVFILKAYLKRKHISHNSRRHLEEAICSKKCILNSAACLPGRAVVFGNSSTKAALTMRFGFVPEVGSEPKASAAALYGLNTPCHGSIPCRLFQAWKRCGVWIRGHVVPYATGI